MLNSNGKDLSITQKVFFHPVILLHRLPMCLISKIQVFHACCLVNYDIKSVISIQNHLHRLRGGTKTADMISMGYLLTRDGDVGWAAVVQ